MAILIHQYRVNPFEPDVLAICVFDNAQNDGKKLYRDRIVNRCDGTVVTAYMTYIVPCESHESAWKSNTLQDSVNEKNLVSESIWNKERTK